MNGEFFTSLLDAEFMMSLSDVIDSNHVQVDPTARLIYFNLVFHGSVIGESKLQSTARGLYLRCLQAIPTWQASATGSLLDLIAMALTTFTTAISFDFNLAWKFHKQSCLYAKQLGLHRLDVLASVGVNQKDLNNQRLGVWGLVLTDLFFRFFTGRESGISKDVSVSHVALPRISDPTCQRPKAAHTIIQTIWARITFIAKEFFEHYDRIANMEGGKASQDFQDKVNALCDEIEEMFDDWQLVSDANKHWHPLTFRRQPL